MFLCTNTYVCKYLYATTPSAITTDLKQKSMYEIELNERRVIEPYHLSLGEMSTIEKIKIFFIKPYKKMKMMRAK